MKLPNVSAKDAADAMQELAKGGLSVNQILGATRGTLQLGLAANTSYAESAVIVARALKAFNLEGSDATRVADLFTAAANKSTADMTDVALGFQMASAQFAAGDQTIQGLTTSLALMANAGIVGSDAGTSLKTMMNRLMAPTKKAKTLMNEMGISVYDTAGNMRSMPNLIQEFTDATRGMTKEQRNAALYTIFGSDAIRASRVMLNAGREGWLKMEKAITKGGEAQKFAEARTKGFNGAVQALWSQIETLAIELGEHLLPAAEEITRAMARFVGRLDANAIAAFFGQITNAVRAIYNFIAGSVLAQSVLGGLLAGFIAFRIISTVVGMVYALAAAFVVLRAAMVAHPIILIIAALVALGVGLYIAYKRSERFREIVNGVWKSVYDFTMRTWPQIKAAVLNAINAITQEIMSWQVVQFVRRHWGTISAITSEIWTRISNIVSKNVDNVVNIVRAQFNFMVAIIRPLFNLFVAIITAAFNIAKAIVSNAIGVITGRISLLRAVINIVRTIFQQVVNVLKAMWALAKTAVSEGVQAMITILRNAVGIFATVGYQLGAAIVQGILSGVSGLASALGKKIGDAAKGAAGIAKRAIGANSPSTLFANQVGKPIADGILRGYLLGSGDLPNKIKESTRKALEGAKRTIDAHRDKMKRAWDRLAGDALRAFDAITESHLTPTEAWIRHQDNYFDVTRLQERLNQAQTELNRALAGEDGVVDPDEVRRALLDVEEAQWALARREHEKVAAEERKQYESQRELQRTHLQDYLDGQWEALQKSPEQWKTILDQTMGVLGEYGVTFRTAGFALGGAFAQGMHESIGTIGAESGNIATIVANMLRLHSPAKEGPLSSLNKWWSSFAPTLLQGLNSSAIQKELAGALAPPGGGIPFGARAGNGGGSVTINNPVFLSGDRETVRHIAELVEPHIGVRPSVGPVV
jgi:TP901 family phage tail tape measure protein